MTETGQSIAGRGRDVRTQALRGRLLLFAGAAWLGMVALAIVNAGIRETMITPNAGEYVGHVASTATLLVLLAAYVALYFRRVSSHTTRELVVVGVLWAGLTVAFELLFGHYVAGESWADLLALYDVTQGYVWILVPLFILVSPVLVDRIEARWGRRGRTST